MSIMKAIKNRHCVGNSLNQFPQQNNKITGSGSVPQRWKLSPEVLHRKNKGIQTMLSEAALDQKWMLTAPVIIVVCADLARSGEAYGQGVWACTPTKIPRRQWRIFFFRGGIGSCQLLGGGLGGNGGKGIENQGSLDSSGPWPCFP